MKQFSIAIFAVLVFCVVGCKPTSDDSQALPSSTLLPTLTNTHFVTQTATVEPVNTNTPTPLPVSTKTPTTTPLFELKLTDEPITTVDYLDTIPDGYLVIADSISLYTSLRLLNLKTNEEFSLGEVFDPYAVSSNNKQLAFIGMDNILRVVNADGKTIKSDSVSVNWRGVIRWVDEHRLLIEDMPLHSDGTYNPPASSVVFDISSSELKTQYLHDFPGQFYIGNGAPEWGPYYFTQAVFDPKFTRVVYPAGDTLNDNEQLGGFPLVLWDMENDSELLKIRSLDSNHGGLPQWERDGSHFVTGIQPIYESRNGVIENLPDGLPYQAGIELCLVSSDGDVERLTYLTTKHNAWPEGYTFSPDENFIAFWLTLNYKTDSWNADRQLAILDIKTGEITNLQLPGGDYPFHPIWSPDGRYLVVTVSDFRTAISDVFIVDLEQRLAMKIAEGAVATGWLLNDEP